ncbi:MAG: fasciclin domain-containing protein [Symploca sp. SIO2C1]|nr:fasciclin domain-containing protein [Symploca sp. SIO2C1]
MTIAFCQPLSRKLVVLIPALIGLTALTGAPVQGQIETEQVLNNPTEVAPLDNTPIAQVSNVGTLTDVASNNEDLSTLTNAVKSAGLSDTLSNDGPYTVFAPTNDAFNALPQQTRDGLLKPENRDLLADTLKNHVVPGNVTSNQLQNGPVRTLNEDVSVRSGPNGVVVNDARVLQPDIPASNGVIHTINRVLVPENVRASLADRQQIRGLW